MKRTLGQIAHDAGEKAGLWQRRWANMPESQRAEWELLAQAVAAEVKAECAATCDKIALKHQQAEGSYAAGKKAGAFECAEMLRAI